MWVRLDDQMPDDPDIDRLSHGAFRLYIAAICFCAAHLTDGHLDAERLPRLMRQYRPQYAAELVDSGLLECDGGTYKVRSYTKYNGTREQWKEEQRKAAERKAEWRRKSGRH